MRRHRRNETPEEKRIRQKIAGWWKDGTSTIMTFAVSNTIESAVDLAAHESGMTTRDAYHDQEGVREEVEERAIERLEEEAANLLATIDNIKEDRELLWLHKSAQGG